MERKRKWDIFITAVLLKNAGWDFSMEGSKVKGSSRLVVLYRNKYLVGQAHSRLASNLEPDEVASTLNEVQ